MRVVDASVVLKWLLQELTPKPMTVLQKHLSGEDRLVAPELINYEVGNVLVTKTGLRSRDIAEIFGHFSDLEIQTYTLGAEEYRTSLDLAQRYKLTVYDASYLALAAALNIKLVTADKTLARRASPLGIVQSI